MTSLTVLVLGANGRFGAAAVQAFAAAGWQVLAQMRRAPPRPLPAGATAVEIPLHAHDALVARAAGARAVVHAVNPPYTRWDAELLPLARQGMDLAQRLDATFMLPGNVYNFGAGMPQRLAEDTPQRPSTRKGEQRVQLEAEMRDRAARGLRSVVIRAGDFYGGGTGSWFDQVIVKDLRRGKLVYPGPLDLLHAWAYLPDLARAFVAAAARGDAPNFETLHFAGHTLTGRELLAHVDAAAASLGLRPDAGFRVGGMPWGVVRAVGLVYPLWRELAHMSYLWRVPHALRGAWQTPTTPPEAALRAALLDLGFGATAGSRLSAV